MGDQEKQDSAMATDSIPHRGRRRLFVLAGETAACCSVLLAVLLIAWMIRAWRGGDEDPGVRFPPGVLADYVPEDSAAVLAVNTRQLKESPIGRQGLKPFLRQLAMQAEGRLPWLELTGINPLEDFDTLLISLAADGGGEPVLLARGRFDRSRFQIGADKLRAQLVDGFRVWEHSDRSAEPTTLLAAVGDTLVVSKARSRVQAALRHARDPQPIQVRDVTLRQFLMKTDRRQSVWLAASIKRLGPISGIDDYLLKMILRPLLAHAESVYGGVTCSEDLRAELHFSTNTDEDADQLETDLKSLCEAAPGAALLGRQNELLPLLRLLAASQIRREGKILVLSCRLPVDQLEK